MLHDSGLVWNKIYRLPFKVALDTYTRHFKNKVLNRTFFTNSKLFKLKLVETPLCSFCGKDEEPPEHLFVFCRLPRAFCKEIPSWLRECGMIEMLPELTNRVNIIMIGLIHVENNSMVLNHLVLITKQTIFSPSLFIFLAHLNKIFWIA